MQTTLATIQGIYYLITGLWPLVHMKSFERVTGPKIDHWLVKTVGVLILCTSLVLLYSASRGQIPPEVKLLAISNAIGLTVIDVWYPVKGRISKVYLLDAVPELILVGLWLFASA